MTDAEGLHENIKEVFDPASNRVFYHNTVTDKTGWTLAEVLDAREMSEVRDRLNTIERHAQFLDSLAEARDTDEAEKLISMAKLSDEEKMRLKLQEKHEHKKRSTLLATSGAYNKSNRKTLLGKKRNEKTKRYGKRATTKKYSTVDNILEGIGIEEVEIRNSSGSLSDIDVLGSPFSTSGKSNSTSDSGTNHFACEI
jgi:hypothetical protein